MTTNPHARTAHEPAPPFSLTLVDCLEEIASRFSGAARVTGAALACARAGVEDEAVGLVLDLE